MNPRISLPPLFLLSGLMVMQLCLGPLAYAQELRREKVTPALTRDLTRRPLATSPSELALGRARAAMAEQDSATAYKEYRVAADSARGVAGLEKVRAEAVRGLCESGVKLAQQRKALGKNQEAERILREILSPQYDPKYQPALDLLSQLAPASPKVRGFAATPPPTYKKYDKPDIPIIGSGPPPSAEFKPRISPNTTGPRATPPPRTTMALEPEPSARDVPDSRETPEEEPPSKPRKKKGGPPPAATTPAATPVEDRHLVKVYFGTDRRATGEQGPSNCFGIDWNNKTPEDPVITGVVTVSIPPGHKEGIIERPSWYWPRNEDPAKDFVLKELRVTNSNDFYEELRGAFGRRAEEDRSAFVYIHGFNVTFDDAAYATAQIVFDLDFKGVPMMFSWPSQGKVLAYDGDQETVDFSAPNLQGFLERVARETGAKRIHLMAHSMGNRLLTRALSELVRQPDIQPLFDNVIMASPDLNAQLFTRLWPKIKIAAKRFTLYASSDDRALAASRTSKGGDTFTRLGEGGPNIVVIPGLDTIDASGIDTSELGHSYEFTCKPVRLDLGKLIGKGIPPDKRELHENHTQEGLAYWRFR
jgi:esterase/lipase superfamily enzyme